MQIQASPIGMFAFVIFQRPVNDPLFYRVPAIKRRDVVKLREIRLAEATLVALVMFVTKLQYSHQYSDLAQSLNITAAAVWILLVWNPDMLIRTRQMIRAWHRYHGGGDKPEG